MFAGAGLLTDLSSQFTPQHQQQQQQLVPDASVHTPGAHPADVTAAAAATTTAAAAAAAAAAALAVAQYGLQPQPILPQLDVEQLWQQQLPQLEVSRVCQTGTFMQSCLQGMPMYSQVLWQHHCEKMQPPGAAAATAGMFLPSHAAAAPQELLHQQQFFPGLGHATGNPAAAPASTSAATAQQAVQLQWWQEQGQERQVPLEQPAGSGSL